MGDGQPAVWQLTARRRREGRCRLHTAGSPRPSAREQPAGTGTAFAGRAPARVPSEGPSGPSDGPGARMRSFARTSGKRRERTFRAGSLSAARDRVRETAEECRTERSGIQRLVDDLSRLYMQERYPGGIPPGYPCYPHSSAGYCAVPGTLGTPPRCRLLSSRHVTGSAAELPRAASPRFPGLCFRTQPGWRARGAPGRAFSV